jgi:pSer/pThr/pTyr-binding forkhead associated (FHA) protein
MASKFQLVMRAGPTPGKIYELEQETLIIGRDINNHIVINDAEISRKHTQLKMQSGGYVIEDLGSTNGTFVNNQRLLGPHLLKHDETITLGDNVKLVFEQLQFDPDATIISSPGAQIPSTPLESYRIPEQEAQPRETQRAPQQPAFTPQSAYQPQPDVQQAPYGAQPPQKPLEPYPVRPADDIYTPDEEKKSRVWLFAGCGCLLVLLVVLGGAAVIFDQLNLYCTPPFDVLFPCP